MTASSRYVLLVTNTRRDEAVAAAAETAQLLTSFGINPLVSRQDVDGLVARGFPLEAVGVLDVPAEHTGVELAIVLGGDGTILRAADLVHSIGVPVVGINLGHVGFLAESERVDLIETVTALSHGDYEVEERVGIEVEIVVDGEITFRSWALNEVTVEKKAPANMIGIRLSVDGHDLTSFAADGIIIGTPTGSTAYSFSAGGPIVWPQVEALLVTPLSAHALFARPLIVPPSSEIVVVVDETVSPGDGTLWCDSARSSVVPAQATVRVRRSPQPVRLARLRHVDFVERLVQKFNLPSESWRNR